MYDGPNVARRYGRDQGPPARLRVLRGKLGPSSGSAIVSALPGLPNKLPLQSARNRSGHCAFAK
jgi:hypothetical protein